MEIAIILVFGFLIFGPDKLPEIARTIGRVVRQFRTAQEQMNKMIQEEIYDPIKDELEPIINPFAGILDDNPLKSTSNAKSDLLEKGEAAAPAASQAAEPSKPKPADLTAALADAKQTRKQAVKADADQPRGADADSSAAKESFAERRARLEREHASKAKPARPPAANGSESASGDVQQGSQ